MAPPNLTQLLVSWSNGDQDALQALTSLVHQELRSVAARCMAGERPGHILQPTALVNEAFLRLIDGRTSVGRTARTSSRSPRR